MWIRVNKNTVRLTTILCVLLVIAIFFIVNESLQNQFDDIKIVKYSKEELLNWYDRVETIGDQHAGDYSTIVSIFYQLRSSKHKNDEYEKWIRTFMQSVAAPLAMIVDSCSIEALRKIRGNRTTTFYVINDLWKVLSYFERERDESYVDNYLRKQHRMDPEKMYHNPHLYVIWNLKPFFMKKISILNPYNSSFFIYTDAGAWRENLYTIIYPAIIVIIIIQNTYNFSLEE